MAFRVEIAPRAFHDLDEIAGYIEQQASFEQAEQWFNAIRTLGEFPHRCPIADESRALGYEVRVLLHGKRNRQFKVFYSVQQKTPSTGSVRVFHVRHWARTRLHTDALRELIAKPAE
ncbi:MAG: type II toxin-antitoxin system RelE/ParE family toxin [Terriglobia bacterium]